MNKQKCINIPIAYCRIYKNGICEECANRFYTKDNLTCLQVSKSCDKYFSNGSCKTCKIGKIIK